jgi:hypothetical protein
VTSLLGRIYSGAPQPSTYPTTRVCDEGHDPVGWTGVNTARCWFCDAPGRRGWVFDTRQQWRQW